MPASNSGEKERRPSWADDERSVERSVRRSFVVAAGALLARKYRLTRPAGFGGMAQLWVATNEATGADVCIKILVVPESEDEDVAERFRREAYAAARLSHRAIVRIFDLVELTADGEVLVRGTPAALAIVMELLHGETLAELILRKEQLDLDETIDLALPIISALAHAHRAGVVHRDLKPENIFLATDPDGHVIPKVLDFGVSKLAPEAMPQTPGASAPPPITLDGVMVGTPSFMSPEQARGSRHVDARSDVFSLGILVYVMLAGRNPFDGENFHSVLQAILHVAPPPLPRAGDVWNVLERALSKDAAARYADAGELGAALRRAMGLTSINDSGPQSIPPGLLVERAPALEDPPRQLSRAVNPAPRGHALIAVVIALLVVAAFVAFVARR